MTRTDLLNEIESLSSDIDNCMSALIKARVEKNDTAVANAQHKMESLMVAVQQDLSVIYNKLKNNEVL